MNAHEGVPISFLLVSSPTRSTHKKMPEGTEDTRSSPGRPSSVLTATSKVEKSPPKSPVVVREKRHVSGPMKFVADEKLRATALEGVEAWRKKFATDPKWKNVVSRIKRFAEEDDLRLSSDLEDKKEKEKTVPGAHVSWPGQKTRPPTLFLHTAAAPRARWDIPAQGPITPLSATPTGNAFGPGGFWASLSPQPATPVPATPITAIPLRPSSPIVPKDPAALAAYSAAKHEIENMALKLCASRLSIYSSSSEKGLVHRSIVKSKDTLAAAEVVLQSKCVDLGEVIDAALPEKLAKCAADEAAAIDTYSIQDPAALAKVDTWLQIDPRTGDIKTILDAQRDALAMLRHRCRSRDLELSAAALRLAWATRMLEDKEREVAFWDAGSEGSDEGPGYEYGNFLRGLTGREGSGGSERWSGSAREGSSVFGSFEVDAEGGVSCAGMPALSTTTTTTPTPVPRTSATPSAHPHAHHRRHTRSKNLSLSLSSIRPPLIPSTKPSSSDPTHLQRHLQTSSSSHGDETESRAPLSPADREFRHQGPSHADLISWAEEMRKLRRSGEGERSERGTGRSEGSKGSKEVGMGDEGEGYAASREVASKRASSIRSRFELREMDCEGDTASNTSHTSYARVRSTMSMRMDKRRSTRARSASIKTNDAGSARNASLTRPTSSLRSSSSMTHEEEDDWLQELQRMQRREERRQMGE